MENVHEELVAKSASNKQPRQQVELIFVQILRPENISRRYDKILLKYIDATSDPFYNNSKGINAHFLSSVPSHG